MIYMTGDTHGDWERFQTFQTKTTKDDTIIVLGDFGLAWNEKSFKDGVRFFDRIPATIIAVMGNHENYDMIEKMEDVKIHGAEMKKCSDNVFYVCNGEIFTIEGKKFFAFGGAESVDKASRMQIEMKSKAKGRNCKIWWEQETPSHETFKKGMDNFSAHRKSIYAILTHAAPNDVMRELGFDLSEDYFDFLNYLDALKSKKTKWFFGHVHFDRLFYDKKRSMFKDIITLR